MSILYEHIVLYQADSLLLYCAEYNPGVRNYAYFCFLGLGIYTYTKA